MIDNIQWVCIMLNLILIICLFLFFQARENIMREVIIAIHKELEHHMFVEGRKDK